MRKSGNTAYRSAVGAAVGIIGGLIARFQPKGIARAMYATAFAQVVVGAIALVGNLGVEGHSWPWDVIVLTGFFAALWLLCLVSVVKRMEQT